MRTSSAGNVGEGKDSEARQRKAIESYAKRTGMVIVDWFYDAAVSGADQRVECLVPMLNRLILRSWDKHLF
jgi:Resolvase, N terminal domain